MQEPQLTITQRRLPHWTLPGSTYYVTFRLLVGSLAAEERRLVLEHVKSGHGRFYTLAAATVMPDHVHLILKPLADFDLSRIMKGIKGPSARFLNQRRNSRGHVWQEESWDRVLRSVEEYEEKLQYMYTNPVKSELVTDADAYDGWYFNPDFV